jgi:release factor glutamine methyltransferase
MFVFNADKPYSNMESMTPLQAYELIQSSILSVYDARESSLIARYLTEDLFQKPFWSEDHLTQVDIDLLHDAIRRLLAHEPWQYIGGKADFYGLSFYIDNRALIPRPETEELVLLALDLIKKEAVSQIMDACTGSGIIGITIALKTGKQVHAFDVDEGVLELAKKNAALHNVPVSVFRADLLSPEIWPSLPKVDMIVSNPPYIAKEEALMLDPNVLDYEPHLALFSPGHPLDFYEALASLVHDFQPAGCRLLVEINEKYGQEVCRLFNRKGLRNIALCQDMQGKDRFVIAKNKVM